jgi:hypothetical protein
MTSTNTVPNPREPGDPSGLIPTCPKCGSMKAVPDWAHLSNLVRFPSAIVVRKFTNVDVVEVWHRCLVCDEQFLNLLIGA